LLREVFLKGRSILENGSGSADLPYGDSITPHIEEEIGSSDQT
jgi:hypothetical protein